jgi:hypothetical protein
VTTSSTGKIMTTYFVSSQIGSDKNAGTSAGDPLASLQAAAPTWSRAVLTQARRPANSDADNQEPAPEEP